MSAKLEALMDLGRVSENIKTFKALMEMRQLIGEDELHDECSGGRRQDFKEVCLYLSCCCAERVLIWVT